MNDLEVKRFIITRLERRGSGVDGDPVRVITQYWDMKGNLVFEIDMHKKEVKYFDESGESIIN